MVRMPYTVQSGCDNGGGGAHGGCVAHGGGGVHGLQAPTNQNTALCTSCNSNVASNEA